ncbi:hypothetical protein SLA2020_046630 [Shorea laevis]
MRTKVEASWPLLSTDNKSFAVMLEQVSEWKDQITIKGLAISAMLRTLLFCIITRKLYLTVGIMPSLNVVTGLLRFFLVI